MNLKRLIGSVAIAGIVGPSTLGIGAGTANASSAPSNSGTALVQPAGYGHGYGYGRGYDHGGYWGGWHGGPFWNPWAWRWHR
jgi:uncharacterized membrane protein